MSDATKNNDGTAATEGSESSEATGAGLTPGSEPAQVEKTAPLDSPGGSEGKTSTGEGSESPTDDLELGTYGNPKNKEAAKWRVKAREAEAERDTLRGTVDSLRVELLAARLPAGIKAKAVLSVVSMDDLLSDGALDGAKIAKAVKTTCQELGIRRGGGSSSLDRAGSDTELKSQHTWGEALRR